MWFFKCKHPADSLHVEKDSTVKNVDADFNHVTHHLYCLKCGERIDITYAQMIGGVDGFMGRYRKQRRDE